MLYSDLDLGVSKFGGGDMFHKVEVESRAHSFFSPDRLQDPTDRELSVVASYALYIRIYDFFI